MAARLLAQARRGVDKDECEVGGGGTGRHVARVLHVAGTVGDHELSVWRGRVAVGHVDRDPLLAFGAQAVGDERKVDLAQPAPFGRRLDRGDLVVEELACVVEQTADQGALAVVDRADSGEAQQVHRVDTELGAACRRRAGQRRHRPRSNPSRLRSSIAVSENRSSARVAPRSEMREAETSRMISSTVSASERTAPVQRRVTDGPETDGLLAHLFAVPGRHPFADGEQHAVTLDDLALVGVVDRRQLDLLAADVLPDVELGPVRQREHAQVLTGPDLPLVQLPQLGSLPLGVPLPERVAERQDALLGARLVLVAAGAPEGGVELVGGDRIEQGRGLQPVAHATRPRVGHSALVDGVLHLGHQEPCALRLDLRVPVVEHLGEVVAGVHVHDREGDPAGPERLGGQVEQDSGVLAPAEEKDGPLGLGGHFADDEDGQ